MITDRNKFNFVTIYCWIIASITAVQPLAIQTNSKYEGNALQGATVRNFSPRVDYNNEWRPVGRGDPLKNDPTYDYSPPALDRVRYWADSTSDKDAQQQQETGANVDSRKAAVQKKDILLLGVANERVRGNSNSVAGNSQQLSKYNKAAQPVLQPKYTSIRRSYYAHQLLPTRLMPPPMQTVAPPHMLKPAANQEYRHNMPSGSYMSDSASTMGMSTYSKPYYSTAVTSPWMHASSSMPQRLSPNYDTHHQEAQHFLSYTRPGMSTTQTENSVRPHQNALKYSVPARKPWVHELLQKEVIKPVKPTMPSTKYLMGPVPTRPHAEHSNAVYSVMSTDNFLPVAFVTTTTKAPKPVSLMTTQTTSPIYITTAYTTAAPASTSSSPRPVMTTSTSQMPTATGKRLLIPTTSNLAYRPTVVPMEMTTDALFSHYNQPEKPLIGPMYLIIEGHSKVKTYGKNELDPHQPKIVPIIPKREPVVRIADPNEKRGTVETFQVRHLHTKTTTTTALPATTTSAATTSAPPATRAAATTRAPLATTTTSTTTTAQPTSLTPTGEPPTGMQSFLSLLDSSLGSIFQEQQDTHSSSANASTILHPITPQPRLEARVVSQRASIDSAELEVTTIEPPPREIRQVYDYDQLPEGRLKEQQLAAVASEEDEADWMQAAYDDVSADLDDDNVENFDADDELANESHQLIKRIDKLVDDSDELEEFDVMQSGEDFEADADAVAERRNRA